MTLSFLHSPAVDMAHRILGAAVMAVPVLLSLTVHEFAHARVALALGDPTARNAGRCTLNPLRHLDPLGTLMFFIAKFGWARPVPVDYSRLRRGGLGRFLVTAAGPGSNLVMALLCTVVLRIMALCGAQVNPYAPDLTAAVVLLLSLMMFINLTLCMFNLIPLYPLDGHHMLREMLFDRQAQYNFMRWQMRFGGFVLLGLLIVPRLLRNVDPIGWIFSRTVLPTMVAMLGDAASALTYAALSSVIGTSSLI